jgi:hypothetical protein
MESLPLEISKMTAIAAKINHITVIIDTLYFLKKRNSLSKIIIRNENFCENT